MEAFFLPIYYIVSMRIAVIGMQGTGKTTLLEALKRDMNVNWEIMPSIGRTMKSMGLPINEMGSDKTQIEALFLTLEQLKYKDGFYARTFVDGFVYTKYLAERGLVQPSVLETWGRYIARNQGAYDYQFYLRPEFEMEKDGVRSENDDFNNASERLFEETVEFLRKTGIKIYELSGSVEERVAQVNKIIKGEHNEEI